MFSYVLLCGGIKLVMMYSAWSLGLEIAADYSRAVPYRLLVNALTVGIQPVYHTT